MNNLYRVHWFSSGSILDEFCQHWALLLMHHRTNASKTCLLIISLLMTNSLSANPLSTRLHNHQCELSIREIKPEPVSPNTKLWNWLVQTTKPLCCEIKLCREEWRDPHKRYRAHECDYDNYGVCRSNNTFRIGRCKGGTVIYGKGVIRSLMKSGTSLFKPGHLSTIWTPQGM